MPEPPAAGVGAGKRLIFVAGLTGGLLLAAAAAATSWPGRWLQYRFSAELDRAPAADLTLVAGQLRSLDSGGRQALVDGLCHHRPEVRSACQQALQGLLEDWRALPPAQAAPRVSALAEQLAARLAAADADALGRGMPIVLCLLDWPLPEGTTRPAARTYACETVIRAAGRSKVLDLPTGEWAPSEEGQASPEPAMPAAADRATRR